jgi:hypothetical protein
MMRWAIPKTNTSSKINTTYFHTLESSGMHECGNIVLDMEYVVPYVCTMLVHARVNIAWIHNANLFPYT